MNKKTFCILPWTHIASYTDGSALLCCIANSTKNLNLNNNTLEEVWNSEHFKSTRLKMLSGERVKECSACYDVEDIGIHSHRQIENRIWNNRLGEDYINQLIASTNSDGSLEQRWITLDLRLGNTCNLQCVMCRPIDSSKWVKQAKILKEELKTEVKWDWKHKVETYSVNNFEWYKNKSFLTEFYESASDMKHIIFGGGEPLYIKEHKEILKRLVELGHSKNISLRYHTNGTIYDSEVVALWEQFKSIEVMISIDGHSWLNSYIRHPADWKTIENNLYLYDNTSDKVEVKLLCTVQALNIYFLPEFAEWLLEQNYNKISRKNLDGTFHPGILHYPQYLCAKILPAHLKSVITDKLIAFGNKHKDNASIQRMIKVVDFMNSEDWSHLLPQTTEYLAKIDELRSQDSRFFTELL